MQSSIHRHHWSSASILHVSVFDIAQQSEPYRNIGKMDVLYSFNFVEVASCDLQMALLSTLHGSTSDGTSAADVTSASSYWVDKRAKVDKLLDYHYVLTQNLNG